jgi:diguanylate cyclase
MWRRSVPARQSALRGKIMDQLTYIAPWVLASVAIGIVVGILLGRNRGKGKEAEAASQEQQVLLKMLADVLGAADNIASNVEHHSTQLQENVQEVNRLDVSGEMKTIKLAILERMSALLTSNMHLQEDLICTRYRLEEQAQEIDSARQEARRDDLTTVANRRAFNEKLHLLMDDWRRQHEPFVLILADLDQFKWVNDSHGHQAGDRVLKAAGNGLKQLAREGDFVGRYGGDEFAILLPKTDRETGTKLAQGLCSGIADNSFSVAVRGGEVAISFSMGTAAPRQGDSDETILQRADQALYRAKRIGRNGVACEEPEKELATV